MLVLWQIPSITDPAIWQSPAMSLQEVIGKPDSRILAALQSHEGAISSFNRITTS
jgi:hypothetical protein